MEQMIPTTPAKHVRISEQGPILVGSSSSSALSSSSLGGLGMEQKCPRRRHWLLQLPSAIMSFIHSYMTIPSSHSLMLTNQDHHKETKTWISRTSQVNIGDINNDSTFQLLAKQTSSLTLLDLYSCDVLGDMMNPEQASREMERSMKRKKAERQQQIAITLKRNGRTLRHLRFISPSYGQRRHFTTQFDHEDGHDKTIEALVEMPIYDALASDCHHLTHIELDLNYFNVFQKPKKSEKKQPPKWKRMLDIIGNNHQHLLSMVIKYNGQGMSTIRITELLRFGTSLVDISVT
jgi:hypothetical protein